MSGFTQSHRQDAGDHEQQFLGQRLGLAPDNGHGEFGKPGLKRIGVCPHYLEDFGRRIGILSGRTKECAPARTTRACHELIQCIEDRQQFSPGCCLALDGLVPCSKRCLVASGKSGCDQRFLT